MEYNKERKKPGRIVQTRGPRDNQFKLENELITELRKQIAELESSLKKTDTTTKEFTAEQMDCEIRKAVRNSLEETKIKNEELSNTLKVELDVLKEKLSLKEEMIEILKSKTVLKEKDFVVEEDRPIMEHIFVDPLDCKAGDNLVSHIDVEDVSVDEKENIQEKVDKLRNLLGGLKK